MDAKLLLSLVFVLLSGHAADAFQIGALHFNQNKNPMGTGVAYFGGRNPGVSSAQDRRRGDALSSLLMSKKDQRFKLAKRSRNEDDLLLTVAEQFRRREGQATISWYPGHIAKAEQRLQEVLSKVDVVVEVRDARVPASTTHPMIDDWLRNRNAQRIVALNKCDLAPRSAVSMWEAYLGKTLKIPSVLVDGRKGGVGIDMLRREILKAGKTVNDRREKRGMLPRNVRVAVMGYPNVGKSAILNRLGGQAKLKSESRAGVTRHVHWVRVEGFDLLDSPGIIPAKLVSQEVAVHLAICDNIGRASYDTIMIAAALVDEMRKVQASMSSYCDLRMFESRYGLGIGTWSGEEYIFRLAQYKFMGLELPAAERILDDWRNSRLGLQCLEPPPTIPFHTGFYRSLALKPNCTEAEIKSAYRNAARKLHPDVGGDIYEWQKILTAYEILSTPPLRQMYDQFGLVWDIKNGKYRVLQPGEKEPGIEAVLQGPGSKLLGWGGMWGGKDDRKEQRGDAKVRKGKLRVLLGSSSSRNAAALITRPPPGAPPIRRLHEIEGNDGAGKFKFAAEKLTGMPGDYKTVIFLRQQYRYKHLYHEVCLSTKVGTAGGRR